jgi:hypothetical protein
MASKQRLIEIMKHVNPDFKSIQELKHTDYSGIGNLDFVDIVVYKESVYLLGGSVENHINKANTLQDIFIKNIENYKPIDISNYDDVEIFIKNLQYPFIIAGRFIENKFNKDIPNNELYINFYRNNYFDIKISDQFKKILKIIPTINYFEFEDDPNKIYTRDELLNNNSFNKAIKLPEFAYHGTSSENTINIFKRGLIPSPDNTIFKVKHNKFIFFASSFKTASNYANMSTSKNWNLNTYPIVLQVLTSNLDKDKIEFDLDFYNAYIGKDNEHYDDMLKPRNKKINYDNSNLQFKDLANKNMGALFNKFAYNGILLPNKINKIYAEINRRWVEFNPSDFYKYYMENNQNKDNSYKNKQSD